MEVTLKIRAIDNESREVIVVSDEGTYSRYYTNTNAIFPLYKELIYFCREHVGAELNICSNSSSFISDLEHIQTSEKRLATMLKGTLEETACSINKVTYVTR